MSESKRIKVDDAVLERLSDLWEGMLRGQLIHELLSRLLDESSRRERMFWDEAVKLAGFKSRLDMRRNGKWLRIRWSSGELEIMDDVLTENDE